MAEPFTVASDGDEYEMRWWGQWVRDRWPSYEAFWVARIVPLTYCVLPGRRRDLYFQTTAELAKAGWTDEDVAIAQLQYTLLTHLGRVFELLDDSRAFVKPATGERAEARARLIAAGQWGTPFERDQFFESFTRLSGASDLADEILARRAKPGTYGAWDERDGGRARDAWRKLYPDPLLTVRRYRNRLVHGRVVPAVGAPVGRDDRGRTMTVSHFPRVGAVDRYLDWRIAFAETESPDALSVNFAPAARIVREAWEQVTDYVEKAWRRHLLPAL